MKSEVTETFVVETPEQLKALSDQLRQRLLEQFAKPATIKAAASAMGQPLTRLYHHVDQLLGAGLIRVVRQEKVRAVTERWFEVVARRFAVSPAAFGGADGPGSRERIARAYVEEVLEGAGKDAGAVRLLRTRVRLTEAARERLEDGLARLLQELDDPSAPFVELLLLGARQG